MIKAISSVRSKAAALFTVLLLITACSPSDQSTTIYDEIVAVEQQFMAAFEHGDASGLAKLYEVNAQLLPANRDFVSGRPEIKIFWRGLMQLGIAAVKLETLEVEGAGSLAYEMGRYTIHSSDDQMIDYGKYIVILRKTEGQWSIYRHIWTTSMIKDNETHI